MYDSRVTGVSEEEKKWQRREDARILARAEEIKADKERLKNAHIGAKEILEEEGRIGFRNGKGEDFYFYGEQARAIIRCLFECAAEKINNYERYCSCCKDYYKNVINEGD